MFLLFKILLLFSVIRFVYIFLNDALNVFLATIVKAVWIMALCFFKARLAELRYTCISTGERFAKLAYS